MDKEGVVYVYIEILHSHEKQWNFAIFNNMDGLGGVYTSEISMRKTNSVWYHYTCNIKNKLMNITKMKQICR